MLVLDTATGKIKNVEILEDIGGGSGTTNYNVLSNKPKINGIILSSDKTNIDLKISNVFEIATTTTLEGFTIPNLTAEDITKIYNSFIGGKSTYIKDTNDIYYNIKQVDNLNDHEISVVFDYFDKMIIEFILDTTTDIITKNGTIIGGGSTATLLDIKTLAQKIADKGWACISQEKTLSKTNNPTIYNDIKDKYDNADKDTEPTLTDVLTSINGLRNIIKIGNKYYAIVSENGWNDTYLYKSTDGIVWSKVEAMLIDDNNIGCNLYNANGKLVVMFIGYNSSKRFITVYDTNTDTQITKQEDITPNDDRAKFGFFYNNKFYFYYTDGYVYTVENFDFQNKVSTNSQMLPLAFDGTYFYGSDKFVSVGVNPYGRICKGTSIDSIDTVVIDDNWNDDMIIAITDTRLYRVSGKSLYVIENGIANELVPFEQYVTNVTNVSAYGNTIYYEYYADFFKTIYTKVSNDGGLTWNNILEDYSGRDKGAYIYCAGEDVFASINYLGKICKCSFSAKQYTDKYLIDGNELEIDYAKSSDGTKIITDLTQTSEISAVKTFLGYFNYFVLDITNEQITLPYNSNLWRMMYVGDDYIETQFPNGNATRLLPQAEVITVSSATPSFTSSAKLKVNANYQCGTITSLTLDTSSVDDSQLETTIRFTAGASFEFSYANAGVKINGSLPTFEEGGEYIILIVNKTIFVSDKIVAGV